jgi:RNA recognition motif-containing protein
VNIYVGNLSFQMTEEDLRAEFAKFGKVSKANIVKDKLIGKSKGFGFVEMPNPSEAELAIKNKQDGTKAYFLTHRRIVDYCSLSIAEPIPW